MHPNLNKDNIKIFFPFYSGFTCSCPDRPGKYNFKKNYVSSFKLLLQV